MLSFSCKYDIVYECDKKIFDNFRIGDGVFRKYYESPSGSYKISGTPVEHVKNLISTIKLFKTLDSKPEQKCTSPYTYNMMKGATSSDELFELLWILRISPDEFIIDMDGIRKLSAKDFKFFTSKLPHLAFNPLQMCANPPSPVGQMIAECLESQSFMALDSSLYHDALHLVLHTGGDLRFNQTVAKMTRLSTSSSNATILHQSLVAHLRGNSSLSPRLILAALCSLRINPAAAEAVLQSLVSSSNLQTLLLGHHAAALEESSNFFDAVSEFLDVQPGRFPPCNPFAVVHQPNFLAIPSVHLRIVCALKALGCSLSNPSSLSSCVSKASADLAILLASADRSASRTAQHACFALYHIAASGAMSFISPILSNTLDAAVVTSDALESLSKGCAQAGDFEGYTSLFSDVPSASPALPMPASPAFEGVGTVIGFELPPIVTLALYSNRYDLAEYLALGDVSTASKIRHNEDKLYFSSFPHSIISIVGANANPAIMHLLLEAFQGFYPPPDEVQTALHFALLSEAQFTSEILMGRQASVIQCMTVRTVSHPYALPRAIENVRAACCGSRKEKDAEDGSHISDLILPAAIYGGGGRSILANARVANLIRKAVGRQFITETPTRRRIGFASDTKEEEHEEILPRTSLSSYLNGGSSSANNGTNNTTTSTVNHHVSSSNSSSSALMNTSAMEDLISNLLYSSDIPIDLLENEEFILADILASLTFAGAPSSPKLVFMAPFFKNANVRTYLLGAEESLPSRLNYVAEDGAVALHVAVRAKCLDFVQAICKADADGSYQVNRTDLVNLATPLHFAIPEADDDLGIAVFQTLLDHPMIDPSVKAGTKRASWYQDDDTTTMTPTQRSIKSSQQPQVRSGCFPSSKPATSFNSTYLTTTFGESPLSLALRMNRTFACFRLLEHPKIKVSMVDTHAFIISPLAHKITQFACPAISDLNGTRGSPNQANAALVAAASHEYATSLNNGAAANSQRHSESKSQCHQSALEKASILAGSLNQKPSVRAAQSSVVSRIDVKTALRTANETDIDTLSDRILYDIYRLSSEETFRQAAGVIPGGRVDRFGALYGLYALVDEERILREVNYDEVNIVVERAKAIMIASNGKMATNNGGKEKSKALWSCC